MYWAGLIIILAASRLGGCHSQEFVVGFLSSESFVRVVGYEGAYNLNVGLKVRAILRGFHLLYTWLLFRCAPGTRMDCLSTTNSARVDIWSYICLAEYWGIHILWGLGPLSDLDTDSQSIYFPSHFHYFDIYGFSTFVASMYLCCWNAVKAWNWEWDKLDGTDSLGLDPKFSRICFWLKGNINFKA